MRYLLCVGSLSWSRGLLSAFRKKVKSFRIHLVSFSKWTQDGSVGYLVSENSDFIYLMQFLTCLWWQQAGPASVAPLESKTEVHSTFLPESSSQLAFSNPAVTN